MLHQSPYKPHTVSDPTRLSTSRPVAASTGSSGPSHGTIGRRSNNGCWTCRLRKKKCDETHPMCATCTFLDIPCFSYGRKPEWMNGGPYEKKVAQEIKRLVSLSVRRRASRNSEASHRQQAWTSENEEAENETSVHMRTPNNHHHSKHCREQEQDHPSSYPSPKSNSNRSLLPSSQTSSDHGNEMRVPRFSVTPERVPYTPPTRPQDIQRQEAGASDWKCAAMTLTPPSIPNIPNIPDLNMMLSSSEESSLATPFPWMNGDLHESEMALLAYYLDIVFHVQFPFYKPHTATSGRGWLLSLLVSRGASYYACLSFSASYQLAFLPAQEMDQETTTARYLALALQQMQVNINLLVVEKQVKLQSGNSSINLLFGILHLILLSLANNTSSDWQMHLQAAAILMPTAIITPNSRLSLTKDPPTDPSTAPTVASAPIIEDRAISDGPAIRFLLSAFTWLDVLATASTGSPPTFPFDYTRLLSTSQVDMTSVTGCHNWAISHLSRVCALQEWKSRLSTDGQLSTRRLVDEASALESSLRAHVAQLLGNETFTVPSQAPPDMLETEYLQLVITTIFALGALTHLHVVVSGPLPGLLEIQESVGQMIAALGKLPSPGLLNKVVWPFCVAGCMANEAQYGFFTELAMRASEENREDVVSRHQRAVEVIRACWEWRKKGEGPCDWISVTEASMLLV